MQRPLFAEIRNVNTTFFATNTGLEHGIWYMLICVIPLPESERISKDFKCKVLKKLMKDAFIWIFFSYGYVSHCIATCILFPANEPLRSLMPFLLKVVQIRNDYSEFNEDEIFN